MSRSASERRRSDARRRLFAAVAALGGAALVRAHAEMSAEELAQVQFMFPKLRRR